MKHLGDSYDIVKQSLLGWLRFFGEWSVHPMFTDSVTGGDGESFGRFRNARVISTEILKGNTDRSAYFSCALSCGNLFLDPTTGLRLEETNRRKMPNYLFGSELALLTRKRPVSLTLVFDQSLANGKDESQRQQLDKKLHNLLEQHNVSAFAYVSHACFIIAGVDVKLLDRARQQIVAESKLPEYRILPVTGISIATHA